MLILSRYFYYVAEKNLPKMSSSHCFRSQKLSLMFFFPLRIAKYEYTLLLVLSKLQKQIQKQKHIEQEGNVAINPLHHPPHHRQLLLTLLCISAQNF